MRLIFSESRLLVTLILKSRCMLQFRLVYSPLFRFCNVESNSRSTDMFALWGSDGHSFLSYSSRTQISAEAGTSPRIVARKVVTESRGICNREYIFFIKFFKDRRPLGNRGCSSASQAAELPYFGCSCTPLPPNSKIKIFNAQAFCHLVDSSVP